MAGFPTPFGAKSVTFEGYDEFVPEHLPEPDSFLRAGDVLAGQRHAAFHRLTRDCFERRGVYDATFGYNLARLNLDPRHPNAGYRYAESGDVLRATFTPTTQFCPQTDTLTLGSFRAWNGLAERHEYDLVRVRAAGGHDASERINAVLADAEATYRETGELPDAPGERGP
jgi:hypothetical protein